MAALVNTPPGNMASDVIVTKDKKEVNFTLKISAGWLNWSNQVFRICAGVTQSGTTAQRPTVGLWIGRPYFDTTLGYQINYNGSAWVDSTGTPV